MASTSQSETTVNEPKPEEVSPNRSETGRLLSGSPDNDAEQSEQPVPKRNLARINTSGSSDGGICRICHEGDVKETLISPCKCSGTMGLVHRTCLERWLGLAGSSQCELCGYQLSIRKQPKRFSQWLFDGSSPQDRKNIRADVLCFVLLTPLAVISCWFCISGAIHFDGKSSSKVHWESIGLIILTVFLLLIYSTWCMIATRYHYKVYNDWRSRNQNVFLELSLAGSQSDDNNNNNQNHVSINLSAISYDNTTSTVAHPCNTNNNDLASHHAQRIQAVQFAPVRRCHGSTEIANMRDLQREQPREIQRYHSRDRSSDNSVDLKPRICQCNVRHFSTGESPIKESVEVTDVHYHRSVFESHYECTRYPCSSATPSHTSTVNPTAPTSTQTTRPIRPNTLFRTSTSRFQCNCSRPTTAECNDTTTTIVHSPDPWRQDLRYLPANHCSFRGNRSDRPQFRLGSDSSTNSSSGQKVSFCVNSDTSRVSETPVDGDDTSNTSSGVAGYSILPVVRSPRCSTPAKHRHCPLDLPISRSAIPSCPLLVTPDEPQPGEKSSCTDALLEDAHEQN